MSRRHSITVEMEVISPLFMGGADPRSEPELRVPSIRGAMRYWLRALTGAAGEEFARQLEERLFGVAGDKDAAAGTISLRLEAPNSYQRQTYDQIVGSGSSIRRGASYLWFAARGTRSERARSAIVQGTRFKLHLHATRSSEPEFDLRQALVALWALSIFGGVGARSRRFAGAIQITAIPSDPALHRAFCVQSPDSNSLAQEISVKLRALGMKACASAESDFDSIHPHTCQIFVLRQTFSDVVDLVDSVGIAYLNFRRSQSDAAAFARAVFKRDNQALKNSLRHAFGLPIPFYYKDSETGATLQAKQGEKQIDRRASPLWMQVVRLASGQHAAVFTWFHGTRFLPQDARIAMQDSRTRTTLAEALVPDGKEQRELVLGFFEEIKNQFGLIPVNIS